MELLSEQESELGMLDRALCFPLIFLVCLLLAGLEGILLEIISMSESLPMGPGEVDILRFFDSFLRVTCSCCVVSSTLTVSPSERSIIDWPYID